jgi:hypothetical protein
MLHTLAHLIVKIMLGLVAAVFAVAMLAALLLALVFSTVRALLTGRKPAVAVVFQQLRDLRRHAPWPVAPGPAAGARGAGEVVDVEAREVPDGAGAPRQRRIAEDSPRGTDRDIR